MRHLMWDYPVKEVQREIARMRAMRGFPQIHDRGPAHTESGRREPRAYPWGNPGS